MSLDPKLKHLNNKELQHRQQLTHYAANDCLSMHPLLIELNYFDNKQSLNDISDKVEIIVSTHPTSPLTPSTNNLPQPIYEPISEKDDDNERDKFFNHRKILS